VLCAADVVDGVFSLQEVWRRLEQVVVTNRNEASIKYFIMEKLNLYTRGFTNSATAVFVMPLSSLVYVPPGRIKVLMLSLVYDLTNPALLRGHVVPYLKRICHVTALANDAKTANVYLILLIPSLHMCRPILTVNWIAASSDCEHESEHIIT